jgi:hypothetical protein
MPVLSTTPLHASPARKTETKTSRQAEGAVALPRKRRAKAARGEEIVVKTGLVVEVPVGGVRVVFFSLLLGERVLCFRKDDTHFRRTDTARIDRSI